VSLSVIARSKATKQSSFFCAARWIASLRSNDVESSSFTPPYTTTLSRFAARVMPV
jgi:hypothetical protein